MSRVIWLKIILWSDKKIWMELVTLAALARILVSGIYKRKLKPTDALDESKRLGEEIDDQEQRKRSEAEEEIGGKSARGSRKRATLKAL
jgi:hypothetical protein